MITTCLLEQTLAWMIRVGVVTKQCMITSRTKQAAFNEYITQKGKAEKEERRQRERVRLTRHPHTLLDPTTIAPHFTSAAEFTLHATRRFSKSLQYS